MNVKFLNPFVEAAFEVVQMETGWPVERGDLGLEKNGYVTEDVTVVIALVGRISGNVFYSMDLEMARQVAQAILGESIETFDSLAQSGVAELGNVITGRASVKLAEAGYEATISPPTMLIGRGAQISTLDVPRLVVPMLINGGRLVIHLALRETIQPAGLTAAEIPVPDKPAL